MVTPDKVRALALALPEVVEASRGGAHLAFEVTGGKGICWSFMRRVHPKKPRVVDAECLAVRCAIERKEMLVEAAPDRFFDDPHYRGYPAVLIRLPAIEADELKALLRDAWRMSAPKTLQGRLAP